MSVAAPAEGAEEDEEQQLCGRAEVELAETRELLASSSTSRTSSVGGLTASLLGLGQRGHRAVGGDAGALERADPGCVARPPDGDADQLLRGLRVGGGAGTISSVEASPASNDAAAALATGPRRRAAAGQQLERRRPTPGR